MASPEKSERRSMRCRKCNTAIEVGWKFCPQCSRPIGSANDLTLEELRTCLVSDLKEYLAEEETFRGDEYIRNHAAVCLSDWVWGHAIEFRQASYFLGVIRCHDAWRKPEAEKNQSYKEAADFFRVASHWLPAAKTQYGMHLVRGIGVPPDPAKGLNLVTEAVNAGCVPAKIELADIFYYAWGVEEDKQRAAKLLLEAAHAGHQIAQERVGTNYRLGSGGFPEDKTQAHHWYKKAAKQQNADAMFGLGCLYYNGEGVSKCKGTARSWFGFASDLGHEDSQRMLEREAKKWFPWQF